MSDWSDVPCRPRCTTSSDVKAHADLPRLRQHAHCRRVRNVSLPCRHSAQAGPAHRAAHRGRPARRGGAAAAPCSGRCRGRTAGACAGFVCLCLPCGVQEHGRSVTGTETSCKLSMLLDPRCLRLSIGCPVSRLAVTVGCGWRQPRRSLRPRCRPRATQTGPAECWSAAWSSALCALEPPDRSGRSRCSCDRSRLFAAISLSPLVVMSYQWESHLLADSNRTMWTTLPNPGPNP